MVVGGAVVVVGKWDAVTVFGPTSAMGGRILAHFLGFGNGLL